MRQNIKLLAAAIAFVTIFFGQSSSAAGLKEAQIAFKAGNWKVLMSIDSMNDKVTCTGIYKENYGIQLTDSILFVGVRGGIQSVTLRFGEKPARRLRLPEEMEKKINSIMFSGADFSELIESDRLRV